MSVPDFFFFGSAQRVERGFEAIDSDLLFPHSISDPPHARRSVQSPEGRLVGIASLYLADMPEQSGVAAWQLRAMATAPEARGMGFGRALVAASVAFARENGARLLWCNARTPAVGFYRKLGFETLGGEFEIPDVGPHFRMMLRLGGNVPQCRRPPSVHNKPPLA